MRYATQLLVFALSIVILKRPVSLMSASNFTTLDSCRDLCPSGSCCETDLGQYECCIYANAVCCKGSRSCCPQRSRCISSGRFCEQANGFEVALSVYPPPERSVELTSAVISRDNHTLCPDTSFACPGVSTCCPMDNGSWGCCHGSHAVCCGDGRHCCPKGTTCNNRAATCDPVQPDLVDALTFPRLGHARSLSDHHAISQPYMSYDGVKCDDKYECPSQTTCCHNTTGGYACCPMTDAVCCTDGLHCCPKGTTCDLKAQHCVSIRHTSYVLSKPHRELDVNKHRLCPDSISVCLEEQTCCKLSDGTWGCCPLPNAVCCPDGQHCCPTGFRCDVTGQKCLKNVVASSTPSPVAQITCPNREFRCTDNSTCCPLPNEEYACCPFKNAVCCPDMAHCCPANTTCDVAGNRCVKNDSPGSSFPSKTDVDVFNSLNVCPSGLMSCPGGTCCKNIFGIDACCPHPSATCCNNGYCCPEGTRCDDSTQTCTPSESQQVSLPWLAKRPAQKLPGSLEPTVSAASNTLCPDEHSACGIDQTCCLLKDSSYGCCPLNNATCCSDGKHCCPSGTQCIVGGFCVRSLGHVDSQPAVMAERMIPMPNPPIHGSHLPINSVELGGVVHATFCGGCDNDWLCCPDANGLPNRMCCPAPGSVCCADGRHCCPSGTTCSDNGQCIPYHRGQETYSALLLSQPDRWNRHHERFSYETFADFQDLPASKATKAHVNVLFLLPTYYRDNAHLHTVCPDRERYCSLDEKCCASNHHGYVCVPAESTCCHPETDTWCPLGTYCLDGRTCKRQPGSM